jgi:hypothetical protein
MLMYKPRWAKKAVDELAKLWADNVLLRTAITTATHQIDDQLLKDPFADSESPPQRRRILFRSPLGILFRVEADEQTVSVLHVWLLRKRKEKT